MQIRPLEVNTRIRDLHSTAGVILSLAQPTDILKVLGEFIAPADLLDSNGKAYQKRGDRWAAVDGGWIAITNMGIQICEEVEELPNTEEYIIHVKNGVQRKFLPE